MIAVRSIAIALVMTAGLAACKVAVAPPPPPPPTETTPSMNFTMKTNHRPDRIRVYSTLGGSQKKGKVRVCLRNSSSGRDKGLHFKGGKPKYVVRKKNQSSCGHYSPGRKTFHLWKRTALGKWKKRATRSVNLTGFAGQLVTFDWVQD